MNFRRETVEMAVPRAAQALAPRAGQPSRGTAGLVSALEQYVAGGACPEPVEGTPEDARKDTHTRGRSRPLMKYAGSVGLYLGGMSGTV